MNKSALVTFVNEQLAINSLATDAELLAALPTLVTKLGRIDGLNKLDLVTIVIGGSLDDRCDSMIAANATALSVEIATKLKKALDPLLLMSNLYRINLAVPEVKALLDGASPLGVGLLTQDEYDKIIALATYTLNDFTGTTLSDIAQARLAYNQANKIYTSKIIQYNGQQLNLTLNTELPTNCAATLWITETGYLQENAGRAVYLAQVGKYKLNLSGVSHGELEVRVPFANADFVIGVN